MSEFWWCGLDPLDRRGMLIFWFFTNTQNCCKYMVAFSQYFYAPFHILRSGTNTPTNLALSKWCSPSLCDCDVQMLTTIKMQPLGFDYDLFQFASCPLQNKQGMAWARNRSMSRSTIHPHKAIRTKIRPLWPPWTQIALRLQASRLLILFGQWWSCHICNVKPNRICPIEQVWNFVDQVRLTLVCAQHLFHKRLNACT